MTDLTAYRTIITEEELMLLFPNQIEREIFRKVLTRLIDIVTERTLVATGIKYFL